MRWGIRVISTNCLRGAKRSCFRTGASPPARLPIAERSPQPAACWVKYSAGITQRTGTRRERFLHFLRVRATKSGSTVSPEDRLLSAMPQLPSKPLWYLKREFFEDQRAPITAAYEQDHIETAARYRERGVQAGDRAMEAFITEHRAVQMIAHQPLAASAHLDVALPFADRALAQAVTRLPMRQRIQNELSRGLLARHAPALLRVPLAATFMPASAPIPVHELARASRLAIDTVSSSVFLLSRGRIGRSRPFGWMNFEQALRPTHALRALVEDLRSPLFDKDALLTHLDEVDAYQRRVKLGHVFLKLAQIDRTLHARVPGAS